MSLHFTRKRGIGMRSPIVRPTALVAAVLLAASCTDAVAPLRTDPGAPRLSTGAATGIVLDQSEGALNTGTGWPNGGTHVGKSFDVNPHLGDAIVVTFYWQGTTNTITTVTDHLEDETPVGNTYTLVDYTTAGGYSMATYIATNVQNFPDPAPSSSKLLAVHAIFSVPVAEGGIMISAYSGVAATTSAALGPHRTATGTDSTTAVSEPGAISVAANALVYGVTMADAVVSTTPPSAFAQITAMWDAAIKTDGVYTVPTTAASVDPQWTWSFSAPTTWFATALALNPPAGSTNQPPTAAFTSSCNSLNCAFTSTSSDSGGSISGYSWSFGDSGTSSVQNPSHTYGAAGTYTVTLTVTDNQGASNSVSHTVTVTAPNQPPVAAFNSSCSGLGCAFTSASTDADGSISAYSWTFGDGATSTVQNPSHAYSAGGTYTVTLMVTDNQGATNSVSHSVTVTAPNQPPVAAFTSSCTELTCTFTSSSGDPDGSISAYSWTFGDGGTSTAQNPSHSYGAGGTYTVTLTVTDNQGATNTVAQTVTVNQPPVVNAGSNQTVVVGVLYTLHASFNDPDNGPWTYTVDWGDGTSTSGSATVSPGTISRTHTYLLLGNYTIRVRVTDSQGASGSGSKVLTVIL